MKFICLFIGFTLSIFVAAQVLPDPPYKRFPTLPPLKLLLADSVTEFTEKDLKKEVPVFIFLFSPDCDHCQKETEELIDNIEKFSHVQIVMATAMPFGKMKAFYQQYQLSRFSNITMGFDKIYLLPTFYRIKNYPFLAFYDKNGKLTGAVEGALPVKKVLEYFTIE
jgi:thiol-disulfide isomerase/thioredoxin